MSLREAIYIILIVAGMCIFVHLCAPLPKPPDCVEVGQ